MVPLRALKALNTLLLAVRTCHPHFLRPVGAHRPHLVPASRVHACMVSNKVCQRVAHGLVGVPYHLAIKVGAIASTTNIVEQGHR